jgi:VWFA-related protein
MSRRPALALPASCLALALGVATGPRLLGQEEPAAGRFAEVVEVEVVDVDVVVVDRDGRPVVGLTREDFAVFEDGELREITNFYSFESATTAFEHHRAGERVASPESRGDQVRRIAILFDANTLTHRERNRAVEAAKRFVAEKFDGSYEWAVVAFDDEVRILQPFTADKFQVEASLERVKDLRLLQRRRVEATDAFLSEDPASTRAYQRVRQIQDRTGQAPSLQDFEVRSRVLESMQEAKKTALAAVYTMRAHARLSGRKSLILVSGALESLPTMEQMIGKSAPGAGQEQGRTDPMLTTLQQEIAQLMGAVVQTANASSFSIYPM